MPEEKSTEEKDTLYVEPTTLSPRVKKYLHTKNCVKYTVEQGSKHQDPSVTVKRYMMQTNKSKFDNNKETPSTEHTTNLNDSLHPLELESLKRALNDDPAITNKVFLWDIIDRKNTKAIHTLCIVKIKDNLYLIDPNNSYFSSNFTTLIKNEKITLNIGDNEAEYVVSNVNHNKLKFYHLNNEVSKRDCIDIAFKIAQRISKNLDKLTDQSTNDKTEIIKGIIKPLSNMSRVNGDLGEFDNIEHLGLQSSDLELSSSTFNLFKAYDELDKAQRYKVKGEKGKEIKPDKKVYTNITNFKRECKKRDDRIEECKQKVEEAENNYNLMLSKYKMEKSRILSLMRQTEEKPDGDLNIHKIIYDNDFKEFTELLGKNPKIINYTTPSKKNLLHIACSYGNLDFIKRIKESYSTADSILKFYKLLDQYDNDKFTPMHSAIRDGQISVVEYLLNDTRCSITVTRNDDKEHYLQQKNSEKLYLHLAFIYNHLELVKLLLNSSIEYDFKDIHEIKDKSGDTLVHYAVKENDVELLELLYNKGANFNIDNNDGDKPINCAFKYGELAEEAHEFLSKIKFDELEEIFFAVRIQDFEKLEQCIKKLGDKKTDILNTETEEYGLIGHVACLIGNLEIIKLLKDNECDLAKLSSDSNTALEMSCKTHSPIGLNSDKIFQMCYLKIADNALDFNLEDRLNLIRYLINDVKINITKKTVLYSLYYPNPEMLELLLSHNKAKLDLSIEFQRLVVGGIYLNVNDEKLEKIKLFLKHTSILDTINTETLKNLLEKELNFEKGQINHYIDSLNIKTVLSQGLTHYNTAVDLLSKFTYPSSIEEKKLQVSELFKSFDAKQTLGELFVNLSKAPKILAEAELCFDEYINEITEKIGDKPFSPEILNIKIVSEQLIPRILRSDGLPNIKKIIIQLLEKNFDDLFNKQKTDGVTLEELETLKDLVYLIQAEVIYTPLFILLEKKVIKYVDILAEMTEEQKAYVFHKSIEEGSFANFISKPSSSAPTSSSESQSSTLSNSDKKDQKSFLREEQARIDELLKSDKLKLLRDQHKEEEISIIDKLKARSDLTKYTIKTAQITENDTKTISVEIATSAKTKPESNDYTYQYRIVLSKDLAPNNEEIASAIQKVFPEIESGKAFNIARVMLINENEITSIPKQQKSAIIKAIEPKIDDSESIVTIHMKNEPDLQKLLFLTADPIQIENMTPLDLYNEYKDTVSAAGKKQVIKTFLDKKLGVSLEEDVYSLLLSEAIQQENVELVQEILNLNSKNAYNSYPKLLTNVDQIQMSPLTYALLLDESGQIKNIIKEHIHGKCFQKVVLSKDALIKMYEIIGYYGESYQECIDDYIKPIVDEREVSVLGEPVREYIDFSEFA